MKLLQRSIGIALLLIIGLTGSVFANIKEPILNDESKTNHLKLEYDESKMDYLPLDENDIRAISPMAVDACPGRGDHYMYSRGWGTLIRVNKDGSRDTIFKGGAAWQCKWCREVVVTQYDPLQAKYVGYYCMRNPGYVIPGYGITMEASPNAIKHTSGSKVPYCKLFYN